MFRKIQVLNTLVWNFIIKLPYVYFLKQVEEQNN
jgi:hypothetical protein